MMIEESTKIRARSRVMLLATALAGLGQAVASGAESISNFGNALARSQRIDQGRPGDRRRRRDAFLRQRAIYEASRHRGYPGAKLARKALKGKVGRAVLR